MLSRVPVTSRGALRTDKVRATLAWESRSPNPDVAEGASLLCDVLSQPTGEAAKNGSLFN